MWALLKGLAGLALGAMLGVALLIVLVMGMAALNKGAVMTGVALLLAVLVVFAFGFVFALGPKNSWTLLKLSLKWLAGLTLGLVLAVVLLIVLVTLLGWFAR
ncbi:MAG: hypothetical protein HY521_12360 [Proteobacteria bacterium]|nr:hypothetical protein [Pseudomonadota bacterium]